MTLLIGKQLFNLAEKLWPINRSITGDGVRTTLQIIKEIIPALSIHEVASGTQVFDWTIPKEWRVNDAYIVTPDGEKICSVRENNLHLVGYSVPTRLTLSLAELQNYLHSLPAQPLAIPYVTSYYQERWGFCLSQKLRDSLPNGLYKVFIDTELFDGSLTYGELLVEGKSKKEILISTYICHPSMANNELSGPSVVTFLAKWITEKTRRKYSYRFVFVPETIGSLTYIQRHKDQLKKNVFAGFNVSCVGDNRNYSYLPSRRGDTISDAIAKHVLKHVCASYKSYGWADRGSDERQYCAPGIDLPIASIMRTKYGEYEEYHTSLDDLVNVVTPEGLEGGFSVLQYAVEALENNCYPKISVIGEPQLGKRGLYPTLSTKASGTAVRLMMDFITWSDGGQSLLEIAELCQVPIWDLYPILETLRSHDLITVEDQNLNFS